MKWRASSFCLKKCEIEVGLLWLKKEWSAFFWCPHLTSNQDLEIWCWLPSMGQEIKISINYVESINKVNEIMPFAVTTSGWLTRIVLQAGRQAGRQTQFRIMAKMEEAWKKTTFLISTPEYNKEQFKRGLSRIEIKLRQHTPSE